jgi:hypothetical protein
MGIFTYEIVLLDIPLKIMLWTENKYLTFQLGHTHFSGVNDPAEIDQKLINCLLKGTVCVAFCLLYFRQLVTIRTTTQGYNHFAGHYKFD